MNRPEAEVLSIRDVLADARYVVPIYQRAYAWGEDEILTLLRDVRDSRQARHGGGYHIGSLVTHATTDETDSQVYEVVDGQQRLTTLFIILGTAGTLPAPAPTLAYEGRPASARDLQRIARSNGGIDTDQLLDAGICEAVDTVAAAIGRGDFDHADLGYLLDSVYLVRTVLPARTDLNHYFEVMNSRGEQLEKHEVVKAALMRRLSGSEPQRARHAFAKVWEACSDLGRHVQAGFPSEQRQELFGGNWDFWRGLDFAGLTEVLAPVGSWQHEARPLVSELLADEGRGAVTDDDSTDRTERYRAIIDFPNFLLHVLALTTRSDDQYDWSGPVHLPLDDKQLVTLFAGKLVSSEAVERFCVDLLHARWLFDRYVIKTDLTRDAEDDSIWVLNRVRRDDSGKLSPTPTFGESPTVQRHLVLLESMFQVTDSRRSYKNSLYALLEYLMTSSDLHTEPDLVSFLQDAARRRFAATVTMDDLDRGVAVPHFALNYLDYLMWTAMVGGRWDSTGVDLANYRFRYRTSVEHFYPQHPDQESRIPTLEQEVLDMIGNLCLMSRSDNSRRSNLAPRAKVAAYKQDRQSLAYQVMARQAEQGWSRLEIETHSVRLRDLLRDTQLTTTGH